MSYMEIEIPAQLYELLLMEALNRVPLLKKSWNSHLKKLRDE